MFSPNNQTKSLKTSTKQHKKDYSPELARNHKPYKIVVTVANLCCCGCLKKLRLCVRLHERANKTNKTDELNKKKTSPMFAPSKSNIGLVFIVFLFS